MTNAYGKIRLEELMKTPPFHPESNGSFEKMIASIEIDLKECSLYIGFLNA